MNGNRPPLFALPSGLALLALSPLVGCQPGQVDGDETDSPPEADGDVDSDVDSDSDADTEPSALAVDADFDSGAIGAYRIEGDTLSMALNAVTLVNTGDVYAYWVHFVLSGAQDRAVTVEIEGIAGHLFFGERPEENQLVYSCDGESWERLTEHAYRADNGGTYSLTQVFPCDEPRIATFFPFTWGEMQAWVADVRQSELVEVSALGDSEQGREIQLLTITNPVLPEEGKAQIFIVGRQHAAETGGSHMLTAMVDFLISGEPAAQPLLDGLVWRIVPMLNPDGVYLGHSRSTSLLRDPNADWGSDESVEVVAVREQLLALAESGRVDMVLDWHSQMNDDRWYDFVYSPSGNSFFPVLSAWTSFDDEVASGASSCSESDCSARGWTMNHVLYDPMFVLEPSPHQAHWTVDSLGEQGVLTAYAVAEYFGVQVAR